MNKAKTLSVASIVHLFSILHAALALSIRSLRLSDEIALTMLTITMAVVICMKKRVVMEFYALSIIIVNVLGYIMGTILAQLLSSDIHSEMLVHAISTFLTTELLGWGLVWLTRFFKKGEDANVWESLRFVVFAILGILMLRLVMLFFLSDASLSSEQILDVIMRAVNNVVSLVVLLCLDVLFIRYVQTLIKSWNMVWKALLLLLFIAGVAAVEAYVIYQDDSFALTYVVSFILHILVFSVVYMLNYVRVSKDQMIEAREKANQAQYRYIKLKNRVNPHFLFNSLNILDCLICEEKTAQASLYTHKLAALYRYLINSEDLEMVSVREELDFVSQYVDLLKVRFPEGLNVEVSVGERQMSRMLLPCAIQLLVENAIKHNAVLPQNPLNLRIEADENSLTVKNNIVPKMTSVPSTGLGHKYIRQQYLDLCGKEIQIFDTEEDYAVVLPLL